jgi:hypothetical protein
MPKVCLSWKKVMRYLAQYAQLEPTPKDWRRLESVKHVLLVSIRAFQGRRAALLVKLERWQLRKDWWSVYRADWANMLMPLVWLFAINVVIPWHQHSSVSGPQVKRLSKMTEKCGFRCRELRMNRCVAAFQERICHRLVRNATSVVLDPNVLAPASWCSFPVGYLVR